MEIFDYDNILLLPRKCRVESRSECDAGVELGGRKFRLPVVPANMKTVVDESISLWLAQHGYFYVMHRFDLDNVQFVRDMHAQGVYASISLGVKAPDRATVDTLAAEGLVPEFITIDIAHGHADSVRDMIGYIKGKLPSSFVIAGNVATPEAVIDLENWGADATKVGVGPGKVCITKLKTGFGTGGWQLSALKWCARVATKPIIADGGIRSHGDIAKSIRFGASMVMIGSLFAGHEESPGKTVEVDGALFKEYYGSASDFNKGEYKHVEGKRILEPIKGKLANTLIEMEQDVQSSISYSGGTKLADSEEGELRGAGRRKRRRTPVYVGTTPRRLRPGLGHARRRGLSLRPQQLSCQLVQPVPGLHQSFQHAEVVQARQGFAHRHHTRPQACWINWLWRKNSRSRCPRPRCKAPRARLAPPARQQRRTGLLHLLGREPQRIGQKRRVAQRLQVVQA
jgi:GMP reductase